LARKRMEFRKILCCRNVPASMAWISSMINSRSPNCRAKVRARARAFTKNRP
jgi:hypothetical protein